MSTNQNLQKARAAKNDEFYTQLSTIEKELVHYKDYCKDKIVYCNCDDARESNFFKYFSFNFEFLGLKKLITTGFKKDCNGILGVYDGEKHEIKELQGNGDFRSDECIEYLKMADIIVTNPPFSLFREYVAQLMEYGKKFLVIGNLNAVTYKEIFPLIKENKLWLGVNSNKTVEFAMPYSYEKWARIEDGVKIGKVPAISWFTNIEHQKRNRPIDLYKKYSNEYYPKYDNYDAIDVSKVEDIPMNYSGVMGVPITFLGKYCPNQFEIVGLDRYADGNKYHNKRMFIDGKEIYARILIKRKVNNS